MLRKGVAMTSILLLFLLGWVTSAHANGIKVVKDIEETLAPNNVEAIYNFENIRLDGTKSNYQVRFEIRDVNHARGYFLKPDREKGREILRIKEEIWTFLPSANRIVRVADRDSFAGGDFSNADILRVDWSSQYKINLKKDLKDQWIFEMLAKSKDATYAKIYLWVDKKIKQPVQQVFFDSRGNKLKRLRYGDVKDFGFMQRPARLVMENLITKQESELSVVSIKKVKEIPSNRFISDNLGK